MRFSKTWLRIIYGVSCAVWLSMAVLSMYRFNYKRNVFNTTPALNGLVVQLNCKHYGTSTLTLESNGTRFLAFFQNKHCNRVSIGDTVSFHALPKPGYALLSDEKIENDFYTGLAFLGLAFGSLFFLSRTFHQLPK
jgi:hypothetical protein